MSRSFRRSYRRNYPNRICFTVSTIDTTIGHGGSSPPENLIQRDVVPTVLARIYQSEGEKMLQWRRKRGYYFLGHMYMCHMNYLPSEKAESMYGRKPSRKSDAKRPFLNLAPVTQSGALPSFDDRCTRERELLRFK